MDISIIIPHYKIGKITAYAVSQFLKFKGKHNVSVVIGDNNPGDGSINYLNKYKDQITIVNYPTDLMQSHGILIEYVLSLGLVQTEYFMTAESDSFPTEPYLDYYEKIINDGYDCAGSLLNLSGGGYVHPAGAIYKKSIWQEAKDYCGNIQYHYFPNIAMKENFPCHLMVHKKIINEFLADPEKYIELYKDYKPYYPALAEKKCKDYLPTTGVFHNGMGEFQEGFNTYRFRNIKTEPNGIILDNSSNLIFRMGYEPGQWLCYYMLATGRKIFYIPTETVWMKNRVNQQQQHTINEIGLIHLWGVTAYSGCTTEDVQDIVKFKEAQVEELWQSIQ